MEIKKGDFVRVKDKQGVILDQVLNFVEVQFEGSDISDIVEIDKIQVIDRVKITSTELQTSLKGVDSPSKEDLKLIEKYQPINADPVELDDTVVVTIIAADNMLDRSLARWNPANLEKLSKLPVGFPVLLDHRSDKVKETVGVVFDSGLVKYSQAPSYFTNTANNGSYNRQILKDEGYVGFVLKAALNAESDLVEQLNLGVGWVSLGYSYQDVMCPICKTSFYDQKCPHMIPMSWADQSDPNYAPWREKDAPVEIYEVSFVSEPNLPRAGIIRNIHKTMV
jgi:hypothetical protein